MARAKPITGLDAQAPVGQNARCIIKVRLTELYDWECYIDEPYSIRELHNLRIAAKRLRYSLEIFADFLPDEISMWTNEVEKIQEELGTLHDSDVIIALLRLCLGSLDSGSGYIKALRHVERQTAKGKYIVNPAFIKHLLIEEAAPTARQRRGLEWLLSARQSARQEQYRSFRQHWEELKTQEMERRLTKSLDQ